ncbi:hypothetical protein DFQ30_007565 [Apophysomyces sp. BC1015]|nr:hypothetical protein DFQ30_007565 [Apophysomyces sp. BC1015]
MATEYTEAEFVGIDKSPIFPQNIYPGNVRFHQLDILHGLPFNDETFEFVNMRMFGIILRTSEWTEVLQELHRLIKPGGCIQLTEVQLMDPGNETIQRTCEVNKDLCDTQMTEININHIVGKGLSQHGRDPYVCEKLGSMLSENGFETLEEERQTIILDNHPLASEFLCVIDQSCDSCRPLMEKAFGLKTDKAYAAWKKKYMTARRESSDMTWHVAVARKPMEEQ